MRVVKHQCAKQIFSRDKACWPSEIVVRLKQLESLLNVKVGILQQKLAFSLDSDLCIEMLRPHTSVEELSFDIEELVVCFLILQVFRLSVLEFFDDLLRFGLECFTEF